MTAVSARTKLRFPRIRRISLERFSLYTQRPDVDLAINPGVLCLAGANGIGKSTFLAAVNFGLTGRVPTPSRTYSSMTEYYTRSSEFSETFFDGRIEEEDRAIASVSLELVVGDYVFTLTRGMFEPAALRALQVTRVSNGATSVVVNGSEMPEGQRHEEYSRLMTGAVGLQSFDQFVFLQHFILTFDESRNLLFWNEKALESSLFLAFDADPRQQVNADTFRREMERAASRGRNYRFHAVRVGTRISTLKSALGNETSPSTDDAELEAAHSALVTAHDEANAAVETAEAAAVDAELDFANASASLITLRSEYAKTFARHVGDSSATAQHPVVREAIGEQHCALCGTEGPAVVAVVSERAAAGVCPLCNTHLTTSRGLLLDFDALRQLDERIAEARERLQVAGQRRDRLAIALSQSRHKATAAAKAIREFETTHESVVRRARTDAATAHGPLREQLRSLEEEFTTLLNESKEAYDERDTWKTRLQETQRKLERQYQSAEQDFVPLFRGFAERFLGMELDIIVERQGSTGLALVLELRNTKRRLQHQLSESQRFFLDIALRMALARFISDEQSRASILIDTPEGSLDIAYESRAGSMFAAFAEGGHDILMTANINTSELLRKLAATCGRDRMTLIRMTEWADLSTVQLEESALFEQAYIEIERELGRDAQ